MRVKVIFVILSFGLLTSCATLNTTDNTSSANSIMQIPDQQKLSSAFNTAKDGTPKIWSDQDENTDYQLLTSNTHVNYQGVPCRDFSLVISRSFYRGETLTGTACRYKNKWKDSKSAQQAYGGE